MIFCAGLSILLNSYILQHCQRWFWDPKRVVLNRHPGQWALKFFSAPILPSNRRQACPPTPILWTSVDKKVFASTLSPLCSSGSVWGSCGKLIQRMSSWTNYSSPGLGLLDLRPKYSHIQNRRLLLTGLTL